MEKIPINYNTLMCIILMQKTIMKIKIFSFFFLILFGKLQAQQKEIAAKNNELGLRITGLTYLFGVNELVTLEYERILNNKSSIGISIGITVASGPTKGFEIIDNEGDAFNRLNKFDFVIQPYYRHFIYVQDKPASGSFLEANLYFGYYPYEIREYHYEERPPAYTVIENNTNFKDAINYGIGLGMGHKFVIKNIFVVTALAGLGIRNSTSQKSLFFRSGLVLSTRF